MVSGNHGGSQASGVAPAQINRSTVVLINFEPNLPIIFLQTTQRTVSELKMPCSGPMFLPPGHGRGGSGFPPDVAWGICAPCFQAGL